MAADKMQGSLLDSAWVDVGTPQRLSELEQRLKQAGVSE